jgi:hypothetical protein
MKKIFIILFIISLSACSIFQSVIVEGKAELERVIKSEDGREYIIKKGKKLISEEIDSETGKKVFNILMDTTLSINSNVSSTNIDSSNN